MESGCDARLDERGGPRAVVLGPALELTRGREGTWREERGERCRGLRAPTLTSGLYDRHIV